MILILAIILLLLYIGGITFDLAVDIIWLLLVLAGALFLFDIVRAIVRRLTK